MRLFFFPKIGYTQKELVLSEWPLGPEVWPEVWPIYPVLQSQHESPGLTLADSELRIPLKSDDGDAARMIHHSEL